jgi:hypothetical protein
MSLKIFDKILLQFDSALGWFYLEKQWLNYGAPHPVYILKFFSIKKPLHHLIGKPQAMESMRSNKKLHRKWNT